MKLLQVILISLMLIVNVAYAQGGDEPLISKNVTVIPKGGSGQCTPSWKGRTYPEAETVLSGAGETQAQTGAMLRSCTDCAVDSQSGDCVCGTCYDYYN